MEQYKIQSEKIYENTEIGKIKLEEGVYKIKDDSHLYVTKDGKRYNIYLNPEASIATMLKDPHGTYEITKEGKVKKSNQMYFKRTIPSTDIEKIIKISPSKVEIITKEGPLIKLEDIREELYNNAIFFRPGLLGKYKPKKPIKKKSKTNFFEKYGIKVIT